MDLICQKEKDMDLTVIYSSATIFISRQKCQNCDVWCRN